MSSSLTPPPPPLSPVPSWLAKSEHSHAPVSDHTRSHSSTLPSLLPPLPPGSCNTHSCLNRFSLLLFPLPPHNDFLLSVTLFEREREREGERERRSNTLNDICKSLFVVRSIAEGRRQVSNESLLYGQLLKGACRFLTSLFVVRSIAEGSWQVSNESLCCAVSC